MYLRRRISIREPCITRSMLVAPHQRENLNHSHSRKKLLMSQSLLSTDKAVCHRSSPQSQTSLQQLLIQIRWTLLMRIGQWHPILEALIMMKISITVRSHRLIRRRELRHISCLWWQPVRSHLCQMMLIARSRLREAMERVRELIE